MQLRLDRLETRRHRSRAAELPDGNAEAFRLIGEVVLDSRTRKMHDADRQQFEHGIVAFERRRFGVLRPVGLESDLWHLPVGGPSGGDQFGALWRPAMDQHHVAMLGVHLVETIPDEAVVVEVETASESNLRTWRQHDLGLSSTFGGDEVTGVDHRSGQCAVVDQ